MKKFLLVFFSLAIGAALFGVVLYRYGWQEIWQALTILTWWQFLLVSLLALAGFSFSIFRWQVIIKSRSQEKVSFKAAVKARTIGFALSYLTPTAYFGGEPLRALSLREETNVDWKTNIFSIVIDKVLDLTIGAIIVLIGIAYVLLNYNVPYWLKMVFALIVLVYLTAGLLFYSRVYRRKGFLTALINFLGLHRKSEKAEKLVSNVHEIEQLVSAFFLDQPGQLAKALGFGLIYRALYICTYGLIIYFLQVPIGVFELISFAGLTGVAYFVPVPGSLGIHEGGQALFFNFFGLGGYNGIAFSLTLRGLHLIGVAIGLLFLLVLQIKIWKNKALNKIGKLGRGINKLALEEIEKENSEQE